MTHPLLFLLLTGLAGIILIITSHYKKVDFKSMLSLFLFGMLISIPFLMIEYMSGNLKYYFVILAFIAIEVGILYSERKIKYFHDLVHHNVKHLRIVSFLLIGLGFTYSEISLTIFKSSKDMAELMQTLPMKTTFSLLTHTVLASATSLIHVGNLFAETILETAFKLFSYYARITVISMSHFLYVFSIQNNMIILTLGMLTVGIVAFFYLKRHIDLRSAA